jgi:glucose-6-phosphate isomerase
MSNDLPVQRPEWKSLMDHSGAMKDMRTRDLFKDDPHRFSNFHILLEGALLDYSKNLVTAETIDLLVALAEACGVEQWRERMFAGEKINASENRSVLHTALRSDGVDVVEGENISGFVKTTLGRIRDISDEIRSNGRFSNIVHIGIGGSDLGPHTVCEALAYLADGPQVHFVSNIDGAQLEQTLNPLDPKSTLFIIASKTFTTSETLVNAHSARRWVRQHLGAEDAGAHFMAVTANLPAAEAFGIPPARILPLREWIGGRYSVWSSVGLPVAISLGYANFERLLAGAAALDRHFREAPLGRNMPVILALLGIWHRNFCGYGAHAVLPYAFGLRYFPAYVQQIDMESNGKSADTNGCRISYKTGPAVFGGVGTDSQHAFFQFLHQGTDIVPCDFIAVREPGHGLPGHHEKLLANMIAQGQAMMTGGGTGNGNAHKIFDGGRPVNTFLMPCLDAYNLGMLMALYEHKSFVQGIIWNVNSFDQWGVELGKECAEDIISVLEGGKPMDNMDSSTRGLLNYISNGRI